MGLGSANADDATAASIADESKSVEDGRVARGLRTREAILLAYEDLILDAQVPPTGADLAKRAGVSARSIFTHFGDMDGVLAGVADRAFEWLRTGHVDIPQDLPLPERLDRFVSRQAEVLERTGPLYRMFRSVRQGARREKCSPEVVDVLDAVDALRRRYLNCVFDFEIGSSREDERLVPALMAASSWGTWEALRVEQELALDEARAVMRRLLFGLLG
jgi:AcrR family transcriptional regulator